MTTEIRILMGIMFFVAFIMFISVFIQASFPSFTIITPFNFGIFTGSIVGVAGTCMIISGIPCAGAMIFFSFLTFIVFSNTVFWVVFVPLIVIIGYIVARLGRGGG